MSFDVKEWAKSATKQWEEATKAAASGDFVNLPDRLYTAKVNEIGFNVTSTGKENIRGVYTVVEGPEAGKPIYHRQYLDQPRSLEFVARMLFRFGVEMPKNPAKLEGIFKKITEEGPYIKVRLVTGQNGYQNARIEQVLGSDYEPDESASDDDEDEDENTAEDETEETEDSEDESEESDEEETEDSDESEDEDEDESLVGKRVVFTFKGEEHEGEIVEVLEDEDKLVIKSDKDGKNKKVASEKCALVEEESDEEEEETEEEEEDESEEEEEEEAPAPKTRKKK
jgi:hypothetical protein